ncbi:hypothetical protein LTR09_011492 [Extremus antarcticus]|uniref:Uncharacterized protein n=1 Tax=Extremus antarcticus TaxID=702011 RepID=A0AAJ0D6E9_9PEZI|nr:hypothetical protein LTR09_011492 [Extremus antarcticus]
MAEHRRKLRRSAAPRSPPAPRPPGGSSMSEVRGLQDLLQQPRPLSQALDGVLRTLKTLDDQLDIEHACLVELLHQAEHERSVPIEQCSSAVKTALSLDDLYAGWGASRTSLCACSCHQQQPGLLAPRFDSQLFGQLYVRSTVPSCLRGKYVTAKISSWKYGGHRLSLDFLRIRPDADAMSAMVEADRIDCNHPISISGRASAHDVVDLGDHTL